jgi:hypothetical protein
MILGTEKCAWCKDLEVRFRRCMICRNTYCWKCCRVFIVRLDDGDDFKISFQDLCCNCVSVFEDLPGR